MNVQFFDHAHHKLKIRGLQSPVDVLTFEGREQLSTPFRYDIQFTSSDKAIAPESVLMQDGAFSLTAAGTGNAGTDCPAHPARRHYRL
jgi:type VI secretion system secreted protein VgrG